MLIKYATHLDNLLMAKRLELTTWGILCILTLQCEPLTLILLGDTLESGYVV